MFPASVCSVIVSYSSFGFSGSRSWVAPAAAPVVSLVPTGASVAVGCAGGLDQFVRCAFPSAQVFSVAQFRAAGIPQRSALAARSVACVKSVASVGGLWVSFPFGPCPASVCPSARWVGGSGSGSWASLALAVGLGAPCLVCLPEGCPVPAWFSSFCFVALGGGFWFRQVAGLLR